MAIMFSKGRSLDTLGRQAMLMEITAILKLLSTVGLWIQQNISAPIIRAGKIQKGAFYRRLFLYCNVLETIIVEGTETTGKSGFFRKIFSCEIRLLFCRYLCYNTTVRGMPAGFPAFLMGEQRERS